MEIAVASVRSPAGALAAGRHGAGLLVLSGVDDASLKHHASNWKIYEETCSRHGHAADRSRWQFAVQIHLAESREQARRDVEYGLEKWIGYANDIVPAPNPPPRGLADPARWMVANERAIIGTPDDAVEKIEHMLEVTGGFGGVLVFAQDWANWQATQRSLELIAEEVRPNCAAATCCGRRATIAPRRSRNPIARWRGPVRKRHWRGMRRRRRGGSGYL